MIRALILNDIRYMRKDPMCIAAFTLPVILGCMYNLLLLKIDFISEYLGVAKYLFIVVIPMMVGMVFGFRFLDEKDEKVLSVYAVSPLGMRKYIIYRMIQCIIVALIEIIIMYLVGIKTDYNGLTSIIMATLLAPFIFLILGILGKNKIQGVTLLKLIGTVAGLPALQVISRNKWDVIFTLIPTDFIFKSTYVHIEGYIGFIYIIGMILLMGLMIVHFYKKSIINI